jgi:hypothetical protein
MTQKTTAPFAAVNAKISQCETFDPAHIHLCDVCNAWMTEANTPGRVILFKCGHIVHAKCFEATGKFCRKCNERCTNFTLCHLKTLHSKERISVGAVKKKCTFRSTDININNS